MNLIGLVISWLVLRFAGAESRWPGDDWLASLQRWVEQRAEPVLGERLSLALVLLIPAFALSLLLQLFGGWFFGLAGLLLSIYVLLYACGRKDYESMMLGAVSGSNAGRQCAFASYDRWFPAACWFLLLGPVGALFYRCVALLGEQDGERDFAGGESSLADDARSLRGWLDWLPARLWAAVFLLAGDFSRAQPVFSQNFIATGPNDQLIDEVSLAALGEIPAASDDADQVQATAQQQQFDQLLELNDRVMWLSLLLLVLLEIIF